MDSPTKDLRVLMVPWLAHGHLSPFLELSKKLMNRNIFIYFCSTPINLHTINNKLDKHKNSIELVKLHLPSFPDLPPHLHTTNGLPPHLMSTLQKAFLLSKPNLSNLIKNLKPDIVIFDVGQPWIEALSFSLDIPCVSFSMSSAAALSFFLHMFRNPPSVKYPHPAIFLREHEMPKVFDKVNSSSTSEDERKESSEMPKVLDKVNSSLTSEDGGKESSEMSKVLDKVNSSLTKDDSSLTLKDEGKENSEMPKVLDKVDSSSSSSSTIEAQGEENSVHDVIQSPCTEPCNILLLKSFEEIEGKYFSTLSTCYNKKVIPVGPLLEDDDDNDDNDADLDIMEWLNKKEPCSTVFVCFGSEHFLSKEDMEEIAHGLELSNVNFIWPIRFPKGETVTVQEVLPEGFQKRVGNRGMILDGWAPQARILKHSSVVAFVSHCGWSSVMESMRYGIAIAAIPMKLDQPINARLVVEIGMGLEIVRESSKGRLQRKEVAKVIREVVVEDNGENVRKKARELSECVKNKGDEEIDVFVEELFQICGKSKGKI